jgi:hypothetical protein
MGDLRTGVRVGGLRPKAWRAYNPDPSWGPLRRQGAHEA